MEPRSSWQRRFLLWTPLVALGGCGSAASTLSEGGAHYAAGRYAEAIQSAGTVMESWPDSPEAPMAEQLVRVSMAAQVSVAATERRFDDAVNGLLAYGERTGSYPQLHSETVGSLAVLLPSGPVSGLSRTELVCPDETCTITLELPAVGDELKVVERVAWLRHEMATKDGAERDGAIKSGLLQAKMDPLMIGASGVVSDALTWRTEHACTATSEWSRWDQCLALSVAGKTLKEADEAIEACWWTKVVGEACTGEVAEKGRTGAAKVEEAKVRLAGSTDSLCGLVPTVQKLFSRDTLVLDGPGLPKAKPSEWWSAFKGESDPTTQVRISYAIAAAARRHHTALVEFKDRTLASIGFVPTAGSPAKYGCWYSGDMGNAPQWTVWDRDACDFYGADWKVREPAVRYMGPPKAMPAEYKEAGELLGKALFFYSAVFEGFAWPREDGTLFKEGLAMQGMSAEHLPQAQEAADAAVTELTKACADWKIPEATP